MPVPFLSWLSNWPPVAKKVAIGLIKFATDSAAAASPGNAILIKCLGGAAEAATEKGFDALTPKEKDIVSEELRFLLESHGRLLAELKNSIADQNASVEQVAVLVRQHLRRRQDLRPDLDRFFAGLSAISQTLCRVETKVDAVDSKVDAVHVDVRALHCRLDTLESPSGVVVRLQHLDYRRENFQGRAQELKEALVQLRAARAAGTTVHIFGLKGMGGVGKSALAAELAEALRQDPDTFPGGVLWANLLAHDPADVASRWVRDLGGDPTGLDPEQCLQRFKERAAAHRVLIVLDNAQDRSAVDRLLVKAAGVTTIITTRFKEALPDGVPLREVDVLTLPDAILVLRSHVRNAVDEDRISAARILEGCARLPLFLNAAGKAVANHHYTLAEYADELEHGVLETLASHDPQAAKVFSLSFRHLSERAKEIFAVLALAPGEDVGPNLVRAYRRFRVKSSKKPVDAPYAAGRLLGELADASLLTPVRGRKDRYRYHDRVRDYALNKLSEEDTGLARRYLLLCFTDWEMVRDELSAAGAFGLAEQYLKLRQWRLKEPPDFAPWYHFIRGQAHVLTVAPELFFQQAFNEPVESPVSQEAQRRVGGAEESRNWLEWINRPKEFVPPACVQVLIGHGGGVNSLSLSVDGRTAVSGSDDKTVRVWDLASGLCCAVLEGHTNKVNCVSLSTNGLITVSGAGDKTVRVWDLATGRCRAILQGHTAAVNSVSLSADDRTAISGGEDKTVRVWDLATGQCRGTLKGHTRPVHCVSLSAAGRIAVSGAGDDTVRVWDLGTDRCRATLEGHTNRVQGVVVSADGRTAISGSWDKTVRAWNLDTGQCHAILQGHGCDVFCVSLSADGRIAVSGGWDRTLRVWDLAASSAGTTEQHASAVSGVSLSADGRIAISGSFDKTLRVWDMLTGRCRATLEGHTGAVDSVSISANGRTAVSGSSDKTVRVWDLATGHCRANLEGHTKAVNFVTVSKDGRIAASGANDESVRVWDLATGRCRATLEGHKGGVRGVLLSVGGESALAAAADETVRVWDLTTQRCEAVYPPNSAEARMARARFGATPAQYSCNFKRL